MAVQGGVMQVQTNYGGGSRKPKEMAAENEGGRR